MATNGKKSKKKIIIWSVIGLVAIAGAVVLFLGSKKEPVISIQIEKVAVIRSRRWSRQRAKFSLKSP